MDTPGPDLFTRVGVRAPDAARAEITPYGAHVTSWVTPDGRERLFLSRATSFSPGSAIRGGVPVVFPQFARRGPLRPHGFARISPWQHVGTQRLPHGASAQFRLDDSDATRADWDYGFRLDLRVTVGGARLELALRATNTGDRPFTFTAALHTYLRVADIARTGVEGLAGITYAEHGEDRVQREALLHINGEIDRIYWDVPGPVTLVDTGHTLRVSQAGFTDVVVWNPGPERAAALPDLELGGYRHMLCIEAAAIGQPITLGPRGEWQGWQRIDALA